MSVAACAAMVGGTLTNSVLAETVTVDDSASATAGSLRNKEEFSLAGSYKDYTWLKGDENSVTVNLADGRLTVMGYSSEIVNDILQATSGTLNVVNGTLTISSGSSIAGAVTTTVAADAAISIEGGWAYFNSSDTLSGLIQQSSGSTSFDNATVNGGLIINGGESYISDSNVNGYLQIGGGTTVIQDSSINGGFIQTDGETYFEDVTKSETSQLTVSGGTLDITGSGFDLNNGGDTIGGGEVNILSGSGDTVVNVSAGTINQKAEVNVYKNTTLNISGGDVTLDNSDYWAGNVNVSDGSLALVGISKNTSGSFTQTGGTTTITGSGLNLNNSSDNISGGTLEIGTDTTTGSLTVSKGTISADAQINLNEGSSLEVKGTGNVTLDQGDYWEGNLGVTGGNLQLNDVSKSSNGTFTQTSGTTTVTGRFDLNNSLDSVTDGTLNIGTSSTSGNLVVNKGTIEEDAQVNLAENSQINLKKGEITLDSDDTWAGDIEVNGGTLNLNNTQKTGSLTQNDGTVNVTGKKFDLNNSEDLIDGGTLNIGNGTTSTRLTVSQGTITKDATVTLNEKATLDITGGNVSLDTDTTWAGNVNVSGGTLQVSGIDKTGIMTQDGGSTTVTGRSFDLNNENDYIAGGNLTIGNGANASVMTVSQGAITKDTTVDITNNATLNVTGGSVELGSDTTWMGNVGISDGNLTVNSVTKNPLGTFTQTGGKTTVIGTGLDLDNSEDIISGGTLNIGNKTTVSSLEVSQGTIDTAANVNVNKNATLTISGGDVTLDSSDSWAGNVNISEGSLALVGINKNSSGKFTQTGGTTTISDTEFDLNNAADDISGGKLSIENSTLNITEGNLGADVKVNLNSKSTINVDGGSAALDNSDTWAGTVNVTGGTLAIDGVVDKTGTLIQKKGTTTVTGTGFDLNNSADSFTGGTLNVGDGTTISDMSVSQGSINANTTVNIQSNAALNITGGTVNLGKNGTWYGDVNVSDGNLIIASKEKNENGKFVQSGGTTTVTGTGFDMNNASDCVSGGTLNVGDGTIATTVGVSKGTIQESATVNVNKNATLDVTGGDVTLDGATDTYNGTVDVSGGSLALVGISKDTSAILKQSGGTTTVTGEVFDLNNSSDLIDGGTFNIGDGNTETTVTVSKGTIAKNTNTNIIQGNNLNITGGKVTLDGATDTFEGNVNLTSGTLNLDGMNKSQSGVLTQTGGTTNVTGTGSVLNNESDIISSGNLNIGTTDTTGELNIENGTIEQNAVVTINQGSSLNIKGGTVTIDGNNDKYNGDVNVSGGTLNLTDNFEKTTTSSSKFNQTGGTTNLADAKLTLNTSDSKITGGTVNISNSSELDVNNSGQNSSILNSTGGKLSIRSDSSYEITGGTVDENSTVTINQSGTLKVAGEDAVVTVDGNNDTLTGNLALSDGTLNIVNGANKTTTSTGTYNQTGGTANITGSTLTLNEIGSVVSGGEVNVTDDAEFSVNNGKKHSSRINVAGSKFALKGASTYETKGGTIDSESEVTIASKSKLEINGDVANVTLNGINDDVSGSVELKNGTLYITDDLTKVTDANGNYIQSGGSMTLASSKLTLADENSKITGGDVNITENSTLTVTKSGGDITGGNIVIDDTSVLNYLAEKGLIQYKGGNAINIDTSGLINMANNVRTQSSINNLVINNSTGNSQADFAVDVYARSNADSDVDTITANSIQVAQEGTSGTIHISDWNLNGDIFGYDAPIDRNIRLGKIFKSDDIGSEVLFSATDKEIFTPIGYYRLNSSPLNDGSYTLDLTRFNPQVFRGQVATAASYMNQLVVNDTLFNRAQIRRYGASYDELFKNKTAILDGSANYERTLKEGGLWTEMFGNFETLKMTRGLNKVRNNSWGFIVGADFGLRELRNGWKWMPTAYIAYNGGHQTFNKVGMYENGGQLGFMSSFSKDKFMETALVYAGIYGTDMSVAGNSEDAFNYFFGLASKTAYDWQLGSHFKVQPSLTLAYNLFGQQNWHSDYGQMGMSSGFLNGFNIAPGVNFIWQQETWNMYATIAYAWNFFGGLDGYAGNVDLPHVRMKQGYLTWGLGMTKSFSDRLMMYTQFTVRNIGRTGIIAQGGLNWRL